MPVETHAPKIVNRAATVSPAAASRSVQCKPVQNRTASRVQASLTVSSPKDPAEKEADATARRIMRMAVPESSVAYVRTESGGVFRQVMGEEKEKKLQRFESPYIARFAGCIPMRKAEGQPNVASNVAAEIQGATAGGSPLPLSVRRFMEPRFRADFSKVKVHTGDKAAKLNRQVNAQAFAVGNSIFFGESRFKPETHEGKELIAHELTHTIQQGAAVQRSEEANVSQHSPVQLQRLGLSDALDYFADKANLIPGFRMFTIILGMNPINMSSVDRSAANILRAMIEFIPGGGLITQALDNYGIFDKIGNWVEQQIRTLGMVGSAIKQAVTQFLDTLSWTDIFDLGGVWDRAKRIFTEPIDRIKSFAKGLVTGIVQFIKDVILRPIAKLAEGTAGYELLKGVLGYDPITGDPVPRTAETLVGPFMKLIGQEEIWENMKKSNAIARCWAWFQGALGGLMGFVREIPGLFLSAFKSLELMDIILVPLAFGKLARVFGGFLGRFISWAGGTIWNLLEIIFDVVSPGALGYIKKTGAALKSILKNPLPFVGNLVKAAKLGFLNFGSNFIEHLKRGLIDWLTGSLPGVYIPKAISLAEVGKFALSVLGITWAQIRAKIVKALGPSGEKIMAGLEVAFDIVKALVNGGPAAAWEVIKDKLNDLKDQVISGITSMVVETVVTKAVPKLIAMFIPGAGFISAIISIYDTVMVFVQKISKIIQVVTGFINSIVAIAAGNIAAAAAKVESVLAGLLSLAISFLAGFVGLGKIADKVMGIVKKVQAAMDKALDAAIAWIIGKAKALFAQAFEASGTPEERLQKALTAAQGAVARFSGSRVGAAVLTPLLFAIKTRYGLASLTVVADGDRWAVEGVVNPKRRVATDALTDTGDEGELTEQELMSMLMGQITPIVDRPPGGMVEEDPKRKGQTRAVTPVTSITISSLALSEGILYYYIDVSPALEPKRESVRKGVAARIATAQSAKNSHEIYKALQQAAGMVNSLFPEGAKVAVVHHEQRVKDFPETFPETQLERIAIPRPIQRQLDEWCKKTRAKYQKMKKLTKQEKNALAEQDIQEMTKLVKKQLQDLKNTRERDEKGKRTAEGARATADAEPLAEIDLIAGSRRGHITVHENEGKSV